MRLLLINPRSPESFWSFRWMLDALIVDKRAVNPPLGLATLAALCPEGWDVEIVDENIESVPLDPEADLIGICGMGVQYRRQAELLRYFRDRGYFVVAGGSYASLCPEKYEGITDAVIAGEAERIWKEFCADFEAGRPRALYRETGEVSLADSPTPRFDLLKLDRYTMVSLQFSRGCPFRCEFCDIIVMFGRKPRTKSIDQVRAELDLLRSLGARNVFFVDDNFIGNRRLAKELLRELVAYQREHRWTFRFGTEASLNLAQDEELLELFRAANFQWVFIGIESPDPESLRETGKVQNMCEDMLTSLRRIYAHGIQVFAGFIVGFDHDTVETFEHQRQFILSSGIQVAMVGLLTALPRTPLYERLERDGRLLAEHDAEDNTKLYTNIVPKQMQYEEMVSGYRELYQDLCSNRGIAERIEAKLRLCPAHANAIGYSTGEQLRMAFRFVTRGLNRGGWNRWRYFLRTLGRATPGQVPMVLTDWVAGLSMRDYAERFLAIDPETERRSAREAVIWLRAKFRRYVREGLLEISLEQARHGVPNLAITLARHLDDRLIGRVARHLEKVLRTSRWTLTIRVERLEATHAERVNRLLRRLARHANRISVSLSDALRDRVEVDSSRFHFVLQRH